MTLPPTYREQAACANCAYGILLYEDDDMRCVKHVPIGIGLSVPETIRLPHVKPHGICSAHERRDGGK